MSNIQKSFKNKAKRGLCMAAGGILGEDDPYKGMSAATAAQYTNDPDVLNNANTAKWAAEEAQRQRSHPGQAFLNPVATQDPMAAFAKRLGDTVGDSLFRRFGSSISPAAPAPATVDPAETTFQQDIDARQSRINGLRKRLGGFADGGIVGSDGLTDAQRAKLSAARSNLGVSNAAPAPAPAPAAPASAPAGPVPAAAEERPRGILGILGNRAKQIDKAAGYAAGGVVGAKTFEFEGKGTGTSDDIPVRVAGNRINVSDGEKAVILPAKTAQNPQALDMIEDVIEQSNGKPPNRGLRNGGNYNLGGFVDDYGNLNPPNRFQKAVPNEILRQQTNNAAPTAQLRPDQTTAFAEKAAANRPVPPAVPKTPTSALTKLGRAATIAGVVGNGIDMATSDIPAEQGAAAIRGAAMINPWLGTAVNLGDAAANKATGGKHNLATGLDAAAKWASDNVPGMRGDYMLPPEFQPGGAGKAAEAQHLSLPEAPQMGADPSRSIPGIEQPQMSTPDNYVAPAADAAPATPKLGAEVARRGLSGVKTIGTANGDVTTGRDKNGQLHVMAGLDNTDAQNEVLRAKEADRMTKDMARQVQVFDGLRAERLQRSPDAGERAMGLAQAQQQILQQQNRNTAANNEATAASAREGRDIQRATLAQQGDHFNHTQAAAEATARAKMAETNIADADKLVEDSGYKGDDLVGFRDAIRMNAFGGKQLPDGTMLPTAADFEKMSPAQRRKLLPAFKSAYEYAKMVNGASISGTSAEFPELQGERPMNLGDVSTDPDSLLGLPRWRGKGNAIGIADLIEAKMDPRISGNMYQFNGGRTVRANAIKGGMGPLGSNDMAALREKQLSDK